MNSSLPKKRRVPKFQRGIMLLEGLIAILIFSLGVLAMVGMQATALNHSGQAKYRTDASFLANKLLARMWVDADGNMDSYNTGRPSFNDWKTNDVDAYMPPGGRTTATVRVVAFPATGVPEAGVAATGYQVSIVIQWRAPNERGDLPAHTYQTGTQIVRNPIIPVTI